MRRARGCVEIALVESALLLGVLLALLFDKLRVDLRFEHLCAAAHLRQRICCVRAPPVLPILGVRHFIPSVA